MVGSRSHRRDILIRIETWSYLFERKSWWPPGDLLSGQEVNTEAEKQIIRLFQLSTNELMVILTKRLSAGLERCENI